MMLKGLCVLFLVSCVSAQGINECLCEIFVTANDPISTRLGPVYSLPSSNSSANNCDGGQGYPCNEWGEISCAYYCANRFRQADANTALTDTPPGANATYGESFCAQALILWTAVDVDPFPGINEDPMLARARMTPSCGVYQNTVSALNNVLCCGPNGAWYAC
eukprot:GHVU01063734.1.p1 GENE.GHVU01063734.1~~GHVU01063734.1.p1  ORF type:complete len:163 (-),score=3.56 GHVU01063734.1:15-503(-)